MLESYQYLDNYVIEVVLKDETVLCVKYISADDNGKIVYLTDNKFIAYDYKTKELATNIINSYFNKDTRFLYKTYEGNKPVEINIEFTKISDVNINKFRQVSKLG